MLALCLAGRARLECDPTVRPDLSVVIPLYNEAPNVEALFQEITAALATWGRPYELILVDDGSGDETFEHLRRVQASDRRVRVIQFRRNFGQTAAFAAGFAAARGPLIATADGDLQNDPRDIPALLDELERGGFDIVCGWRKQRQDPWLSRRLPSGIANAVISWATGVKLNDYGCSLKVFRAEVVKPLRLYGELHRFLPALASEMGVRIAERPVNHRARKYGVSKYGLSRTLRVILDLVTVKFLLSYSTRPLQMFGALGLGVGTIGALFLAYLAYVKFGLHRDIGDRPLLAVAILLIIMGVQFVTVGLVAELQARTYHESQGKPVYMIRQVLEASEDVT